MKCQMLLCGMTSGDAEIGDFYPIRPECIADVPKTRFKPRAGKTLSARRWHAAFSEDGHLDIAPVLRRIQRGGVHPAIKGLVWEFLLGCFDPNSTFEDRNDIRQRRREQYNSWKTECQEMCPVIGSGKFLTTPVIGDDGQPITDSSEGWHASEAVTDKKVLQWMLTLHQIGLDVVRTDQSLEFYQSEVNSAKLWDILVVYSWIDTDIGYVQGMNDICSPMVILLENDADAYWCFDHAMRRLRENFRTSTTSIGVQTQLSTLSQVIKTVDPKLHQHLEDLDGGEYLFAFRMLMVLFRREFSFVDSLYLWELMWAMEYNPNIFTMYEESREASEKEAEEEAAAPVSNSKQLNQYGKFERKYVQTGTTDQHNALSIFLVASVLEAKNKKILKEAKGLDDVVQVNYLSLSLSPPQSKSLFSLQELFGLQILGDATGNLDAKKVCQEALKIHKKYLSKVTITINYRYL
ncbi:TBC1 domain family member 15 [Linum grandiflorum]